MVVSLASRSRTVRILLDQITEDFDCTLDLDEASVTWEGITLEGPVHRSRGLHVHREGITLTQPQAEIEIGLPPKQFRALIEKLKSL